jgi:hypothetical protein
MKVFALPTALAVLATVAGAVHAQDSAAAVVPFVCSALTVGEEPGESELRVSGDTVFFTYYFVDTECREYTYDYRAEKQSLVVTRRPADSSSCSPDAQALYGMSGSIVGVAPGGYWFILRTVCAGKPEELAKEAVQVRKKK